MDYIIRKRTKDDCKAIANIVTIAWNETYKGIVPDWFLEELKNNEEDRAQKTYNDFDENNNNQLVLEVDNNVVGFANFGATHDDEYQDCGEIFALYIIKKYQGYGFGRKLVEEAKTQDEVAEIFGCNKATIARQEQRALVKMRHPRNTRKMKDFAED